MSNQNPSYKLTGINPLAYMGVEPYTPPGLIIQQRRPTVNDNHFNIGQLWVIRSPQEIWMLVQLSQGVATWVQLYPGGGGGGASNFPTNIGTATQVGGVLNVLGANVVETLGSGNTVTVKLTNGSNGQIPISGGADPIWANITAGTGITVTNGANSITIAAQGGQGADSFIEDTGSAAPVAGVINVLGANVVSTFGSGNTIHVGLNTGTNGQIPIASTGNPTAYANITSSAGTVTVTNGPNSINLDVTAADASSFVSDAGTATPVAGVLNIKGANLINTSASGNTVNIALNKSNNGQIPIGATGNPTVMANITSADNTVTITNGPNTIDLSASAEVNPASLCNFFMYQNGGGGLTPIPNAPYDGGGSSFFLGQLAAMTITYDVGSNCSAGTGSGLQSGAAKFTAPATGKYLFGASVCIINQGSGTVIQEVMQIWAGNVLYNFQTYNNPTTTGSNPPGAQSQVSGTILANLTSGQICRILTNGQNPGNLALQGSTTNTLTNFWGYRVA